MWKRAAKSALKIRLKTVFRALPVIVLTIQKRTHLPEKAAFPLPFSLKNGGNLSSRVDNFQSADSRSLKIVKSVHDNTPCYAAHVPLLYVYDRFSRLIAQYFFCFLLSVF